MAPLQWHLGLASWPPRPTPASALTPPLQGRSETCLHLTFLSPAARPSSPLVLRPHPPVAQEGPGFLTPAALDGEAEETRLASVAGLALDARAAGALPGPGVALVLLGAQWVALTAAIGKEPGLSKLRPLPAAAGEGFLRLCHCVCDKAPSPCRQTSNGFPQAMPWEAVSKNVLSPPKKKRLGDHNPL